ncbi:alpha/beta hydrolase [Microbacterium sp. 13-71-7]|uniref:alpha/beta fold hydrolase n=1 Tax=Microbacterium sp. 13-71-7 TaxID=1970399 RepID=UPI000BC7B740|nr:alpha/beta hydrolase [Microbacterium sp. 13-71-7]OZB83810.1 MAG: alpha/beta hydrolase [Microbacterium sp. 13-71-7]
MDIILVPGLWLDADSWAPVLAPLRDAGHTPRPLTLPGVGVPSSGSAGLRMDDWIAAVVAAIDEVQGDVVLVGHSGGGNVIWGAVDARPDRVRRAVFVDTVPPPNGSGISEFPVVDGVIPFPGWDFFDAGDVADLDAQTRAEVARTAQSVPAQVPTDPIALADPSRYDVPVTLLMGSLTQPELEGYLAQWGSYGDEYRRIRDAEVVRIGSGHWPQYSAPERLAELMVAAVR